MTYEVTNGPNFENTASQLPDFTADITGAYKINDKLDVGTTVYFVGERDVYRNGLGVESLDSFIDLNLDVNYKINSRLTAFLRGNNLTGGNYQYYLDYPVQDLQVLGGAVYKFDF
jgi:outer membrane cobalamin receptor